MRSIFFWLLLAIVATAPDARADRIVGNGGVVLDCPTHDPRTSRYSLLDYYDATVLWNFTLDTGPVQDTYGETLEFLLSRLGELSPLRADLYRSWLQEMLTDVRFVDDQLQDTGDSGSIVRPEVCLYALAANQRAPLFPGAKRFTMSRPIWMELAPVDQSGLLLHEMIYREFLTGVAPASSEPVRYLTSFLSSTAAASGVDAFEAALLAVGLPRDPNRDSSAPANTILAAAPEFWTLASDQIRGGSSTIRVETTGKMRRFSGEVGALAGSQRDVGFATARMPIFARLSPDASGLALRLQNVTSATDLVVTVSVTVERNSLPTGLGALPGIVTFEADVILEAGAPDDITNLTFSAMKAFYRGVEQPDVAIVDPTKIDSLALSVRRSRQDANASSSVAIPFSFTVDETIMVLP